MYEKDVDTDRPVELTETVGDLYDIVRSDAATIPEDATLRDAVEALLERHVTRKAYVVDKEGRPVGTITMETLMRHLGYRIGARPSGVRSFLRFVTEMESDKVKDFMAKPSVVRKDTRMVDIVRKVVEDRLNDFPIVDENGKLIGELNTMNLLKAFRGVFRKTD